MRLRYQLWLVSLLILCLPWAGCQFVKETESAMLHGQEQALLASARAVSLRLAADQSLGLSASSVLPENNPLYFHRLKEAPVVDGSDDEWRNFSAEPVLLLPDPNAVTGQKDSVPQVQAGIFRGLLYLFLRVPDNTPDYLDPSLDPLTSGDYLRILRSGQPDLYLGASAPGNINARFLDGERIRPEYGLSGVWNHNGEEYLIELRMQPRLLAETLGVEFFRRDESGGQARFQVGLLESRPLPFLSASASISAALDVFAQDGLRLSVIDNQGWLLGQAGNLNQSDIERYQYGLLTRIYRIILNDGSTQPLQHWQNGGRLEAEDAGIALAGEPATARFSIGDRKVGRSAVPLMQADQVIGAVIAEQASDSLTTSTNRVFNRLLFWTVLSMLLVGIGLLLFASLLSFRIRKLSKAADCALDERGNLQSSFPVSSFNDEIGDLSRSYNQLLSKLHDYTEYLKTLAGKLSHELKTPLAVVRTSLENLEQQELSPEARVYTDRASDGASRLSAIFSALSGASRLEESIQAADIELVDLSGLVKTVYPAYVDAYPDTKIVFVAPPDSERLIIEGAPELIVQMFDKLIDNAVGFCSKDGAVELSVTKQRKGVVFSVSNDGSLLPKEMNGQLFDSLVSLRANETDHLHLGLGLYIARLIAESHGGGIRLENRLDLTGVMASVYLPLSERS